MKYPFKYILLFSVLWGGMTTGMAQPGLSSYDIAPKLNTFWPSSVSASQLFRKPAEEIDYATGQATIRIPLYEIRTADFVLPISIYFTTCGIKTNQLSGTIGAGWQLEAEPMISRIVRGRPDEFHFLTDSTSRHAQNNRHHLLRLATGEADIQQDIFHYRLLSGSGKFLLGESSHRYFHPIPLTQEGVRITTSSPHVSPTFENSMSITDPSGNLYVFGKDVSSRELTYQGEESVTAWKASEILSPNGDFLRFSYVDNAPNEYPYSRYDFYMVEDDFPKTDADLGSVPPHPGYWVGIKGKMNYYYLFDVETDDWGRRIPIFKQWEKKRDVSYSSPGSRIQPRPVKRIDFAGGSVRFNYQAKTGLLERVEVYSGNSLIRSIRLSTIGSALAFLDKIEISGSDANKSECYRFDYTADRDKITEEQYKSNVGSSVFTDWDSSEVIGQTIRMTDPSGNADLTFIMEGSGGYFNYRRMENLCKVVYPSGGHTEYQYGIGWANLPTGHHSTSEVAGKRLSSIIEHPVCGNPVVRTFKYGDSPELTGVGYTRFPLDPSSFSKGSPKHYILPSDYGYQFVHSGYCRLYSNQNLYSSDDTVYYPYVMETINGISTLRHFNCYTNFMVGERPYFPDPIGKSPILSMEDSCAYYDGKGHTATRRSSRQSYHTMVSEMNSIAMFEGLYDSSGNIYSSIEDMYLGSFSEKGVDVFSLEPGYTSMQTDTYNGSDVRNTNEIRTYSTTNPRRLQSISTGRERVEFSYPTLYNSTNVYHLMEERNELNTPVESRHYVDGVLRKSIFYQYEPDADTERGYSLSSIKESTDASGNNFRVAEQYDGYLRCGKPSQATRLDGTTVSFVWAYGGLHPIATIEGMTAEQISAAGIDLNGISTSHTIPESVYGILDGLRTSRPEARVTTYRYLPMIGQVRQTAPDGVTVHYDYDSSGRLSTIKNNSLNTISTYEYHETNP